MEDNKNIPNHIQSNFQNVLREKMGILEFEKWIYNSLDELEAFFDKEDYLDLISFNYKQANYTTLNKFLTQFVDLAEIETGRLIGLLNRVHPNSRDIDTVIELIKIEYLENDYHFLRDYYFFLSESSENFTVSDYWKKLTQSEKNIFLEFYKLKLKTITETTLEHLKNGTITIKSLYSGITEEEETNADKLEEQNNYEFTYIDNRQKDEQMSFDCISMKDFYSFYKKE